MFRFASVIALVLVAPIAAAESLPKELLLRCNFKQTTYIFAGPKSDVSEMRLTQQYRLKDGVFYYQVGSIPAGKDCKLMGANVLCEYRAITSSRDDKSGTTSYTKRESSVNLNRETGEFKHMLDSSIHSDPKALSKERFRMATHQVGVCESIGKRVF